MCVVGVARGTQVVPEESTARLHAFLSPPPVCSPRLYALSGKRNRVNPEQRTIRYCSSQGGFARAASHSMNQRKITNTSVR